MEDSVNGSTGLFILAIFFATSGSGAVILIGGFSLFNSIRKDCPVLSKT